MDSNLNNNMNMIPNKQNLNQKNPKHLLFFSEMCKHSDELLGNLKHKNLIDKVHLVCIDNRYSENNVTHIYLNQKQTMPLPPMITCVPTLCIMPNYEILKGGQIMEYFAPMSKNIQEERQQINMEPNAFSLESETNGSFGVSSDSFSFWDTDNDDLSAQGNGGTRQMYTYASIEATNSHAEQIYTPSEETSDKNTPVSLDQIQQQRNNEL
uniref:Thioredoxin-like fold domain-containing protein n=1 Tax=viral metagenome TaxID=1070528 RepID=A0A6C0L1E1_9ZZZZ|tara:strand:+ start:34495 stop:35124 length:630 start_codon:yes stop_codon:yes gene_type:complete